MAGYRATGGIDAAVATAADAVYDKLDDEGKEATRRLLLRLVSFGEGTADTRRRVSMTELTGTTEPTESAAIPQAATAHAVLTDLIQARLLTADTSTDGTDTVEISHEALLSAWPKLHEWLNQDRSGQRTHRDLTDAARSWQAQNRDPSRLFTGTRLAVAREWAASHDNDLNLDERAFLDACQKQRRTIRRRRAAVVSLVGVLTLLAAVGLTLESQASLRAREATSLAISNQINAEAAQLQITDPSLAAQLDLVDYRLLPTANNYSRLLVAANVPLSNRLVSQTGPVWDVAFSPPGLRIVAVSSGDTVQLWNATDPAHPALLTDLVIGSASDVAFSPDGRFLAVGGGYTVQLWNLTNPAHITPISLPIGGLNPVLSVAFNPTGQILAVGAEYGQVQLWNVINPGHAFLDKRFVANSTNVLAEMAFSPSGRTLAIGDGDKIWLWDIATGQISGLVNNTTEVSSVAINDPGDILAVGSGDGTVRLWNITRPAHVIPIVQLLTTSAVNTVEFAGRTLVSGSSDGTVRLWDVNHPAHATAIGLPVVDASPVSSVAFSPNGYTLAVGSQDGTAKLWNLSTHYAIERICAVSSNLTRLQWNAYLPQLQYDPPCARH